MQDKRSESVGTRNQSLDALRGVAALGVLLFHLLPHLTGYQTKITFLPGKYGVELFFMISGYVILMTAERRESACAFAKARFKRLYPTFWACCFLTILIVAVLGAARDLPSWIDCLLNFSMFPKFFGADYVDGVYWTLELELIFYAVVFCLMVTRRINYLVLVLSVFSLVTSAAFFFSWREASSGAAYSPFVYRSLYLLMDGKAHLFLIGVLAYELQQRRLKWIHLMAIPLVFLAAVADQRISLEALFFVLGIFGLSVWGNSLFKVPKVLLLLGWLSYPLYLLHFEIGTAILAQLQDTFLVGWPVTQLLIATSIVIVLSLAVANLDGVLRKTILARSLRSEIE